MFRYSKALMTNTITSQIRDTEKLDLLFKKNYNKPCTNPSLQFFQEPNINSRNYVYQEDVLTHKIPDSAPSDLQQLRDNDLDDSGRPLLGSYAGKTSAVDTNIRYYHKIPFEPIPGSNGKSFQAMDAGQLSHPGGYGDVFRSDPTDHGYFNGNGQQYGRVMQGSVPFNYASDGTYSVSIYKQSGAFIPFGVGGSVIDARPGIVTYFATIAGVSDTQPIYVSFYRYVGALGGGGTNTTEALATDQVNTFTAMQIFNGGVQGVTSDVLSSIKIDTRDISTLNDGELMKCLQIGGDYAGSFRLSVQKVSTGSRLLLQARGPNSWITKTSFTYE